MQKLRALELVCLIKSQASSLLIQRNWESHFTSKTSVSHL